MKFINYQLFKVGDVIEPKSRELGIPQGQLIVKAIQHLNGYYYVSLMDHEVIDKSGWHQERFKLSYIEQFNNKLNKIVGE